MLDIIEEIIQSIVAITLLVACVCPIISFFRYGLFPLSFREKLAWGPLSYKQKLKWNKWRRNYIGPICLIMLIIVVLYYVGSAWMEFYTLTHKWCALTILRISGSAESDCWFRLRDIQQDIVWAMLLIVIPIPLLRALKPTKNLFFKILSLIIILIIMFVLLGIGFEILMARIDYVRDNYHFKHYTVYY